MGRENKKKNGDEKDAGREEKGRGGHGTLRPRPLPAPIRPRRNESGRGAGGSVCTPEKNPKTGLGEPPEPQSPGWRWEGEAAPPKHGVGAAAPPGRAQSREGAGVRCPPPAASPEQPLINRIFVFAAFSSLRRRGIGKKK